MVQYREKRIQQMQVAINNIAPWLSAALSERECCDEFKDACDAIFNLDNSEDNK